MGGQTWPASKDKDTISSASPPVLRSTRAWAMLSATLVAAVAIGSIAAAPAAAQVAAEANPALSAPLTPEREAQVSAITKALNVSEAQAVRDVQVEDAAVGVTATIEETLGESYADMWFDPWHGTFDIGVAPSTAAELPKIRALVSEQGLEGVTDFVPVRSTLKELLASNAGWTARLGSLIRAQQASTGIDASNNAVVLKLSDRVAGSEVNALTQASRTDSANVRIQTVPAAQLESKADSTIAPCEFTSSPPYLSDYCDPPFIGGVEIWGSANGQNWACTAGFQAQSIYPKEYPDHYLITAGHCFQHGYEAEHGVWASANHNEEAHAIGYPGYIYTDYRGDAGFIDLSLEKGYWQDISPQGWSPWVYTPGAAWGPSTATESYMINYVGTNLPPNIQYQTPCHVGTASGVRCGVTERTNVTERIKGDPGEIGNLVENTACTTEGDSGGPWIFNNYAMGIAVSGKGCPTAGSKFDDLHATDHILGLRVVGWQGTTE